MTFNIKIDKDAFADIEAAAEWYNEQSYGLGTRFKNQVKSQIFSLETKALAFGVRYADVRCMLVHKFPFLVHYKINETESTVEIFAVLHTSRNPKIWEQRRIKRP
jgi:mRNA-degrading endonuclease RelE of RelBE toxin-antitoxin system